MEESTKCNVTICVNNLREALKNSVAEQEKSEDLRITEMLNSLIDVTNKLQNEGPPINIGDVFSQLLRHHCQSVVTRAAKTIAEMARTEYGRQLCTNVIIIKALLELLKNDNIDMLIQTSRALGNICCENEEGSKLIEERNGLKCIIKLLQRSLNLGTIQGADMLRNVAGGLLLNFLIVQDCSHLLDEALQEGIVPIICGILEMENTLTDEAKLQTLLILGVLKDANIQFLDERLTKVLVKILASDEPSELSEMCLKVLHAQADDEEAKLLLAKSGICELLLRLLEQHSPQCTNDEARSVLKVACNLIILILTGDESMNLLYNESKGPVYTKLVEWLESKDEDLRITAVLAMSNFARSDKHCELLVSQDIHKKLFTLIKQNHSKNSDIRLQHALLSALRNLVIPASNKPIILNSGLVEILYPMLDIPTFPVVFKLLGTLRIVIDGQREAAISLGRRNDFLKKVVDWSTTEDHPGVQGEANRLISWLITNSRDKQVILSLIENGAIKQLVNMLSSHYVLMQNEALISLSILCAMCLTSDAEKQLIDVNVGETLSNFLGKNTLSLDLAVINNAITLTDKLMKSESVLKHLKRSSLFATFNKLFEVRKDVKNLVDNMGIPLASVASE